MQYKIIVDKQPRTNPSSDKRQYVIDIEELRYLGDIYDSLIITKDSDYVIRKLSLSEYGVLSVLDKEVIEPVDNIDIELFEGENYIYLADMTGNYIYAEYLLKNEFTDMYITEAEMNTKIQQTYNSIELSVNQKLTSYSTIEELTNAKNEAIDTANGNTDEKLKNYTTTIDMQGKIEASASSVITEVSRTYSTKKETSDAKDEAIKTANGDTDDKLKDYYTIEETIGAITTEADKINLKLEKKVDEEKITGANIILAINNDNTSDIAINADKINIDGKATRFTTEINETYGPFTSSDADVIKKIIMGEISLTTEYLEKYDINNDGEIDNLDNLYIIRAINSGGYLRQNGKFSINPYSSTKALSIYDTRYNRYTVALGIISSYFHQLNVGNRIEVGTTVGEDTRTTIGSNGVFVNDDNYGISTHIGTTTMNYEETCEFSISKYSPDGDSYSGRISGSIYGGETVLDVSGGTTGSWKQTLIKNTGITTPKIQIGNEGYVMYGKVEGHKYRCHWTESQLQFWVDEVNIGTLSDARLKTEIQDIDEDFIKAIKEIEMKQFKVANRNGLVSFGILAQDLIEIFKKYNKNPFDYEIVQETEYRTDDDTIYYTINYEQYLILKTKAQEIELENQQKTIDDLIKRIERLEEKNGIN